MGEEPDMRSRWNRNFWSSLILAIGLGSFSFGCASASKAPVQGPEPRLGSESQTQPMGPPESYGPPIPDSAQVTGVANPDAVVLMLGPGMAPGFSCVGILKAVHEMKVPLRAIYANEVCALVAALYLTQPTLNRMDWALMQFKEDRLSKDAGGLSLGSTESKLERKLAEVFGNRTLEELKIPLRIPLLRPETGEVVLVEKGKLSEAVRAALSTNRGLKPGTIEGVRFKSVEKPKYAYPIADAWRREGYPLVVAETSGGPAPRPGDGVPVTIVRVPLNGIAAADFKKRNQATFRGKNAFQNAKSDILGKIGRTE